MFRKADTSQAGKRFMRTGNSLLRKKCQKDFALLANQANEAIRTAWLVPFKIRLALRDDGDRAFRTSSGLPGYASGVNFGEAAALPSLCGVNSSALSILRPN